MIAFTDAGRRYGKLWALRSVTLEIPEGTAVALLGPNGSGKSTLLRLATGLIKPTTGTVTVAGENPRASKALIGYLGHEPYLYKYLSAAENLAFYADLYRVDRSRITPLLEDVDLAGKGAALVRTFSRGEIQRLGIARALLHNPDLLLLDEPFTGLDEAGTARMPELFLRPGRTILLSTHDRALADRFASRRLHLEAGRLVPEEAAP